MYDRRYISTEYRWRSYFFFAYERSDVIITDEELDRLAQSMTKQLDDQNNMEDEIELFSHDVSKKLMENSEAHCVAEFHGTQYFFAARSVIDQDTHKAYIQVRIRHWKDNKPDFSFKCKQAAMEYKMDVKQKSMNELVAELVFVLVCNDLNIPIDTAEEETDETTD
jgi:hypothetical protein